uniref:Uncharacterized protein n=1 Tax=Geospiza parvula TaxID=87175 RepID=A0A8C3NBC7_GEOPR
MSCSAPPSPPLASSRGWPGSSWTMPPEHSRKAQLDRLDINVQIDDSYLVEAGDRQKRWQCRMCEKSYTSKYNLVTHILGHNGIKPHSCPHCNKLFKQPSHLQTHLLTHQGTRPHKCGVCSKAFTQTSHLKRHMLLHTDIKPYSCRFCGRGANVRPFVCTECGMEFSQIHHLKQHSLTHKVGAQVSDLLQSNLELSQPLWAGCVWVLALFLGLVNGEQLG